MGDSVLVDLEFGTGAVKVTPAHDANDFDMGQRHKLPRLVIMSTDGRINENGGRYEGLDRFVSLGVGGALAQDDQRALGPLQDAERALARFEELRAEYAARIDGAR